MLRLWSRQRSGKDNEKLGAEYEIAPKRCVAAKMRSAADSIPYKRMTSAVEDQALKYDGCTLICFLLCRKYLHS